MQRQWAGPEGLAAGGELAVQGGLAAEQEQQGDDVLEVDRRHAEVDALAALGLDAQQDRATVLGHLAGDERDAVEAVLTIRGGALALHRRLRTSSPGSRS